VQKILVGVDTSVRAPLVLNYGVELAQQLRARLTVIRAVPLPVEFPIEALSIAPDALPTKLLEVAEQALDQLVANVPKEFLERKEARLGTPWQVLCDAAKEYHVDLVLIGTHGYRVLDRIIGTTAARVVNHAPCSVLAARVSEQS